MKNNGRNGVKIVKYISVGQAAEKLSVSKRTIYRRIKDGGIPAIKLSEKCIRIKESDLEAMEDAGATRVSGA